MNIVALLIQIISGAVGGNVAGSLGKDISLGPVGNSITGAIGGVGVAQILGLLVPALSAMAAGGGTDLGSVVGQLASGGVGGAVVTAIVGLIKQKMAA